MAQSLRDFYDVRFSQLKQERSSFDQHWKEAAEYVLPRRGRWFVSDRNKGDRRHNKIINSKGTMALRVATGGMFAGTMSPTRPWFQLETDDKDLMESQPVKVWISNIEMVIRKILGDGNFYLQARTMIPELLQFGTGAISHLDDRQDVARFYTHTIGSYFIGQDERCQVTTFAQETEWTVQQIVQKFARDGNFKNVSLHVKTAYDNGSYNNYVPVIQFTDQNPEFTAGKLGSFPFRTAVFETAADHRDTFLEKRGFFEFPVYVPRWENTNEDTYGTNCPGFTALGDVKQLQTMERRKAQGIDKMVNPPLTGPASVKNVPVSSLPGGLTVYDGQGDNKLGPMYMVNPQLGELRLSMQDVERRIELSYFNDLFYAITQMEGVQPRNQLEIMQRDAERLLQVGPVLQSIHGEFLTKAIDRIFNQMVRAKMLVGRLAPPPELQGKQLGVTYISSLAQAQRAVATDGIDRLAGFVGGLVQAGLTDGKKFDADQAIDEYGAAVGVAPRVIKPDEAVAGERQQEQQAAAAQQQAMLAESVAKTAKTASEADTEGDNGLTSLLRAGQQ